MKYYVDEETFKDELFRARMIANAPNEEIKGFAVRFSNALRKRGIPFQPVIEAMAEVKKEETD